MEASSIQSALFNPRYFGQAPNSRTLTTSSSSKSSKQSTARTTFSDASSHNANQRRIKKLRAPRNPVQQTINYTENSYTIPPDCQSFKSIDLNYVSKCNVHLSFETLSQLTLRQRSIVSKPLCNRFNGSRAMFQKLAKKMSYGDEMDNVLKLEGVLSENGANKYTKPAAHKRQRRHRRTKTKSRPSLQIANIGGISINDPYELLHEEYGPEDMETRCDMLMDMLDTIERQVKYL